MSGMTAPLVPVSWGELIDKITILEIKTRRLASGPARSNAARELALLLDAAAPVLKSTAGLAGFRQRLSAVNERLWDVEDQIRSKEAGGQFDSGFIALARAIYHANDERAAIKREVNRALASELVEEKSYPTYGGVTGGSSPG